MKQIKILLLLLIMPSFLLASTPAEKPRLIMLGSAPRTYFGIGFEFEKEQLWNKWFNQRSEMQYWGNFTYRHNFGDNTEIRSKFALDPKNHDWNIAATYNRYHVKESFLYMNEYRVKADNIWSPNEFIQTYVALEYLNQRFKKQKDEASLILGVSTAKRFPLLIHANGGVSQRGKFQGEVGVRFGEDFLSTPLVTLSAGYWMGRLKMDTSVNYQFFSGIQAGVGHERFAYYHNTYLSLKFPLIFL